MKKYCLYLIAAALLLAACNKEPQAEVPEDIPVTGVSLNLTEAILLVGNTLTLEATVEPCDATNQSVTWSSDDESVATVSPEGEVTAVAPGTAIITITAEDGGFTATCAVTIEEEILLVPVIGVSLNLPDAVLLVGAMLNLEATVEPCDATNQTVTWSSDDESVATVSPEGEVTAVAPGTAMITVTTDDGRFTATCAVTIEEGILLVPVIGVSLNLPDAVLLVGNTLTFEATVEPGDATNQAVTWSSDDESVATVNPEGEVAAVAAGTTLITVTTEDGGFTATCAVTIEEEILLVPVTGVSLNLPNAVLLVGAMLSLEATVEPYDATNQTVTWSSDDESVATVSPEGEVTAVATGTAMITVTTEDGGFMATCVVNVSSSFITMTTLATGVSFQIGLTQGIDHLSIDWGDGEGSKTYSSSTSYLYVSHNYSNTSEHHITIIGGNIRWLSCYGNQLAALDVSRYPDLELLYCSENKITTLDVSRNTALSVLDCYRNQLTALDVSKNTALTNLKCYDNQLTVLDVSRNTDLLELHCSDNQLTALDVSKNTKLSKLHCSGNRLTDLDVCMNIALEELYCYSNLLTALDVSRNTALFLLLCYYNQLTALDVSMNPTLAYLSCSENQLTALDVSKNTALIYLSCGYNHLTTSVLNEIFMSLPQVRHLSLSTKRSREYPYPFELRIHGNPGTDDCDVTIAEGKGWFVFR